MGGHLGQDGSLGQETAWPYLKRSLAGLAKRNISQLTAPVKTRLRRMQHQPGLPDGFLARPGPTSHPSVIPTIKDL